MKDLMNLALTEMPEPFSTDERETVGEFKYRANKWLGDHYLTIRAALSRPPASEALEGEWSIVVGDWQDELVAIHGPDGLIACGLNAVEARKLVNAHNFMKGVL